MKKNLNLIVTILFSCAILFGCLTANYYKPGDLSKAPAKGKAYIAGNFKGKSTGLLSARVILLYQNLDNNKCILFHLYTTGEDSLAVVEVNPGRYYLAAIQFAFYPDLRIYKTYYNVGGTGVANYGELDKILPKDLDAQALHEFSVKENQMVYVGDFTATTAAMYDKYPRDEIPYIWTLDAIKNNFSETVSRIKARYPQFKDIEITSVF